MGSLPSFRGRAFFAPGAGEGGAGKQRVRVTKRGRLYVQVNAAAPPDKALLTMHLQRLQCTRADAEKTTVRALTAAAPSRRHHKVPCSPE